MNIYVCKSKMNSQLTLFSFDRNTAHHSRCSLDQPHARRTEQLFLRVPEIKLPEYSGRRFRKSKLQSIVVDNENSMQSIPEFREMFNVRSRIFSENFTGSRLRAELRSCAQCMLVHYGNPVGWHRLANDT